jgi:hypothetical protein
MEIKDILFYSILYTCRFITILSQNLSDLNINLLQILMHNCFEAIVEISNAEILVLSSLQNLISPQILQKNITK